MPDVGAEKNDSGYYYPNDRATLVYNENYGTSEPSTINASDLNTSLGDANEEFMRQEELRKNEEASRRNALQKDQDAQIQATRENIELQMLSAALTAKPTATPDVADRKPQISQQMVRLFIGGQDKGDVPAQISYIPQYNFNFNMYTPEKSQLDFIADQIRAGAATVSDLLDVRKYMLPLAALTVMNSDVLTAGLLNKFKSTKSADKRLSSAENSIPDWLQKRFKEGNDFNEANRLRYPHNEVEVTVDGKKFRVDSYNPGKEIISRKNTQLSDVQEGTAKGYMNELKQKYPSGAEITDSPFNSSNLKGKRLDGELILEIPVQNNPIPKSIIDAATERGITIRDVEGKVYN